MCTSTVVAIHVLTRDEKEGRKKKARSNKQQGKATQHTQGTFPKKNELLRVHVHVNLYVLCTCLVVHVAIIASFSPITDEDKQDCLVLRGTQGNNEL